eukprot:Partr_v1_DN27157_c1_g1_i2_m16082 putative Required for the assembly of the V0 complex of the vacuolar ATPase (V-ATPase) in the endoplasmic reticulum (By similarity)
MSETDKPRTRSRSRSTAGQRQKSKSPTRLSKDLPSIIAARPSSSSKQEMPGHVIAKLIGFSVLMIVGPIGSYFFTLNRLFDGNPTYAAIFAVVVTNCIIAAYVVVAWLEDDTPDGQKKIQ